MHYPIKLAGRQHPAYFYGSERIDFRFYDATLSEIRRLDAPAWASFSDGRFVTPTEVLFRAFVGTNVHFYRYNLSADDLQRMADQAGSFGQYSFQLTNASRQIVFDYSSYIQPPEIYRINLDGAGLTPLSQINAPLQALSQTRMDPVSFTLANGQAREGWLLQPADAAFPPQNVPIVVWQEGGPGGVMNNTWGADIERPFALLPNVGIAVLVTPLVGREGYGPAFFNALADDRNFGQIDIDEQAEIVRQMIAQGWTRPGQIGITGCSYGGYFALQSVVRHPDLYGAANPQCALIDTIVEWKRGYPGTMPFLQGPRTPYTDPEEYQRDSPIYHTDRIQTPVLTFHGDKDFLPVTLNENLHQMLVARNVPARMLKFIDGGHGQTDPGFQLHRAQEQIAWFRQHLKPKAEEPALFTVRLPLVAAGSGEQEPPLRARP
jgi:dipeptidyl aminopeptidase/acylaminoacyl peptidase